MAAVSDVTIANRAIQRLGSSGRISALSQNSNNAKAIVAAYDVTRRRVLRSYAWTFAKARASVAADAAQTAWGALNRYIKPIDFLRLLRPTDQRVDWEIEGQYIVTSDSSPLQFTYIFDETNPANFDPMFVEAFSCVLAYECCEEIAGSTVEMLSPDEPDSWARAMEMQVSENSSVFDEKKRKAIDRSRQFSWESVSERVNAVLLEAMDRLP